MTEEEWRACGEPTAMLELLRDKASERKLRLFAVAACRRLQWSWDQTIEITEGFADRLVSRSKFMEVRLDLLQNASSMYRQMEREDVEAVLELIRAVTEPHAAEGALRVVEQATAIQHGILCDVLREIFGNPFRPLTISPSVLTWHDATIVRLARAAYEERLTAGTLKNARLAILADALEEAGCNDEQILTHLRSGGEHYRGCFVLDALLGKS